MEIVVYLGRFLALLIFFGYQDNKNKKNKYILGVPIVGGREEIALNIDKYDVDEIIIGMDKGGNLLDFITPYLTYRSEQNPYCPL